MRPRASHRVTAVVFVGLAAVLAGCDDGEGEHPADAGTPSGPDAGTRPDALVGQPDALDAPPTAGDVDASTAPQIGIYVTGTAVATNAPFTLDGRASWDPLGRPLTYFWTVVSAPAGSSPVFQDATAALTTFTPDRDGDYQVELTVTANRQSSSGTVTLTAYNGAPYFAVTPTPAAYTGSAIEVTAAATDPNGDALTYRWTLKGHPDGSSAVISPSSTPGAAHLVPDVDGPYVLEVIASDGRLESSAFEVTVMSYHPLVHLHHRILDAEASRSLGRIILVDDQPAALYIYDPSTDSEATVALSANPTAVSVSPDGHYAVVGHEDSVSYVDLVDAKVVRVYAVTAPVGDIVLAGNGYFYVFPSRDQWVTIHTVNLQTGYETNSGSIYASTKARLHPDGNRIYAADSTLYDYSLATPDTPTELGSSFQDTHPACGGVWFTDDGVRIVTGCGNTFRATSDSRTDMTYVGSLAGFTQYSVGHLSHAQAAGKLLAIRRVFDSPFGDPTLDEEVWVYGDQVLELDRRQPLGAFVVNSAPYGAHGRFAFPDPDGQHYHVFVQADPTSALLEDFAVATFTF